MNCPVCRSELIRGKRGWFCEECEQRFAFDDARLAVGPPDPVAVHRGVALQPLVPELPFTLAVVIREYIQESNDYQALHRMCGALEIVVRFLTAVVLADLWRQRSSAEQAFPDFLVKHFVQHLERPTLASWRVLLEGSMQALADRRTTCAVTGLPAYAKAFAEALGAGKDDPCHKLLPMRNLLAHGGRISEELVTELLAAHTRNFEALLQGLQFFQETHLVASAGDGRVVWLRGLPGATGFAEWRQSSIPAAPHPTGDWLFLLTKELALDLCPLHAYGEVFQPSEDRLVAIGEQAAQLYARRDDGGGVDYTALGSSAAHSHSSPGLEARFREIFPLEAWRTRLRVEGELAAFTFTRRMDDLLKLFLGREDQLQQAISTLESKQQGIVWIGGKPGMGKSAFMAALTRNHLLGRDDLICIPYFFTASEHEQCRASAFAHAGILRLARATNCDLKPAADPRQRLDQFRILLSEVAKHGARKIVIMVDGVDEVVAVDRSFLTLPFDCQFPGVVWMCAGRDEADLRAAFSPERADWLFEDGLPPLDAAGVRAFFIEELGHRVQQFFGRDRKRGDGSWSNDFVEEVIRRSDGLPLYLRLLVQDLRAGRMDFSRDSEQRLPRGLEDYYERLVGTHPDLQAVMPSVLALLAEAREPLPRHLVCECLQDHELVGQSDGDSLLDETLRFGHVMLRRSETPEHQAGYDLYHYSFRQYLLASVSFRRFRAAARNRLTRYCWSRFEREPADLSGYALRHLPTHLAESERWSDLLSVVVGTEPDYLYRWTELGEGEQGLPCLTGLLQYVSQPPFPSFMAATLATHAARLCSLQGDYDRAQELFETHVLNREVSLRARVVARHEIGSLHFYRGDLEAAIRCYEGALRSSLEGSEVHHDEASSNLVALATVASRQYRFDDTIRCARQALVEADLGKDFRHQAAAERLLGTAWKYLGNYPEAEAALDRAARLCAQHELRMERLRLLMIRGWLEYDRALLQRSAPVAAAALFEQAHSQAKELHDLFSLVEAKMGLGWCALGRGESAEARESFVPAKAILPEGKHAEVEAGIAVGLSAMLQCEGKQGDAEREYQRILAAYQPKKLYGWTSKALVGLGAIQWHSDRHTEAEASWREALEEASRVSEARKQLTQVAIVICREQSHLPLR